MFRHKECSLGERISRDDMPELYHICDNLTFWVGGAYRLAHGVDCIRHNVDCSRLRCAYDVHSNYLRLV